MIQPCQGTVAIRTEGDVVLARKAAREIAKQLGFGVTDVTRIVTATSELARNIFLYAGSGEMFWQTVNRDGRDGLEMVFKDQGPGIADIERAMQEGYTSGGGMGMGLPGTKRLLDEMEIQSEVGKGTTITGRKWLARIVQRSPTAPTT